MPDEISLNIDRLLAVVENDELKILARLYLQQHEALLAEYKNQLDAARRSSERFRLQAIMDQINRLKAYADRAEYGSVVGKALRGSSSTSSRVDDTQIKAMLKEEFQKVDELLSKLGEQGKRDQPPRLDLLQITTLVVIIALVAATVALIMSGRAEHLQVEIQWEVGSIVQAIAVGIAALLAAVTYWRRSSSPSAPRDADKPRG